MSERIPMRIVEQQERALDRIRDAARTVGYAIGEHGSRARDLDLIAVPWTDEAGDVQDLLDAVCGKDAEGSYERIYGPPNPKPHGRTGFRINGFAGCKYVDLSVMPRAGEPSGGR